MSDKGITAFIFETITGAACTTDVTLAVNAPRGAAGVEVTGSNNDYWNFTPRLQEFLWDNNGTWTCLAAGLSERGTNTLTELDAFDATDDDIYVGVDAPFRGVYFNLCGSHLNSTAASGPMTGAYWKACVCCAGPGWSALTITDGTCTSCVTFAKDGVISWTVPTDWLTNRVNGGPNIFHVRLNSAADFDADTIAVEAIPLSVQTTGPVAYAITTGGPPPRYWFDRQAIGGINTVLDASDTLIINWIITGNTKLAVGGI